VKKLCRNFVHEDFDYGRLTIIAQATGLRKFKIWLKDCMGRAWGSPRLPKTARQGNLSAVLNRKTIFKSPPFQEEMGGLPTKKIKESTSDSLRLCQFVSFAFGRTSANGVYYRGYDGYGISDHLMKA